MRAVTERVLGVDLTIQMILVATMLAMYVLGLFGNGAWILALLAQFFVGVVQVISGVLHSVAYQDKKRRNYATFAIPYVAALMLMGNLVGPWGFAAFFIIFVIIIPVIIAIWYTQLTYNDWKKVVASQKGGTLKKRYQEKEDILDDVEWL